MAGYHNNLALHISETTLKGKRRLFQEPRFHWGFVLFGLLGASAIWAAALALI
jgi:hypothetical protein